MSYIQAAHQIEILSTGWRGQIGPGLLIRTESTDRRYRRVWISREGEDVCKTFLRMSGEKADRNVLAHNLARAALPGFDPAIRRLPGVSLGTLTVFLKIGVKQSLFGLDGEAGKIIADELKISNFPRHLAALGAGTEERPGYGVLELRTHANDRRVKLPELTAHGHDVLHDIASAVLGVTSVPVKRVKPEVLDRLPKRQDMNSLTPDDYEDFPPGVGAP